MLELAQSGEGIAAWVDSGTHPCGPSLAEALCANGRLDEASESLSAYEARAVKLSRRSGLLTAARVRAALDLARGEPVAAVASAEGGLAVAADLGMPIETARLRIVYGRALAEAGEQVRARQELAASETALRALGANAYADQCGRAAADRGAHLARGRGGTARRPAADDEGDRA